MNTKNRTFRDFMDGDTIILAERERGIASPESGRAKWFESRVGISKDELRKLAKKYLTDEELLLKSGRKKQSN
jgi:hypothetical protein